MLTVSADPVVVESQLAGGALSCPCGGVLGPWWYARERTVVGGDRVVRVRPRRGRCRSCGGTHVLLPTGMLLRRAYAVEVIGRVVELFAGGMAVRRVVVVVVGLARSTVRGWLSRFVARAELLRAHFTRWALWLEPLWTRLEPHASLVADAVEALLAAGEAARRQRVGTGVWQFASMATGGRLLSNTSAPFPAPWAG